MGNVLKLLAFRQTVIPYCGNNTFRSNVRPSSADTAVFGGAGAARLAWVMASARRAGLFGTDVESSTGGLRSPGAERLDKGETVCGRPAWPHGGVNTTELNNLPISRLPEVLREDTLMEGYFGLIENAATYCARLHEAGVRCSTTASRPCLSENSKASTRAAVRLFTALGIRSLERLGEQEPRGFRSQLKELIENTGIVKAIPSPKEVMSDVCWARLYPVIISMPELYTTAAAGF